MNQIIDLIKQIDLKHLESTLRSYSAYGPLPGILLPLLESFLPILPLLVFVAANANIYGLWLGSLYSWLGVCGGSIALFWLARKFGWPFRNWIQRRFPKSSRFFEWIERKGFTPIFLMACFPFAPSALINIVSGLGNVSFRSFALAILLGKGVMILSVSLLSFNIGDFTKEPWRPVLMVVLIAGMWLSGKKLDARFQLK